jgi:hypothetical protein
MNVTLMVVLAAIVGFVLGAAAMHFTGLRRRSQQLKTHFGHEYEHVVREIGNRTRAESLLEERKQRVQRLRLRSLSQDERASFEKDWNVVQARFVDDPGNALTQADTLIGEVMSTEGYPVRDFEQRAADISVEHPKVVAHYRAAHSIALRNMEHAATTEDLRKAMLEYRMLFEELVGEPAWAGAERNRA